MIYKPYSYSKISTYLSCPKKFKYNYIDKLPQEQTDMTALLKGRAVHSILKNYPEKSTNKLVPKFQDLTENFINSDIGSYYIQTKSIREYKFGLSDKWEPAEYRNNSMFRGIVDYVCTIDNTLNLCDWKTGKYVDLNYQSFDQLLFYSIYFFLKYENLDKICLNYVYVEHQLDNKLIVERSYLDKYIVRLKWVIEQIETEKEFKKNPSKLCNYCTYKTYCLNN